MNAAVFFPAEPDPVPRSWSGSVRRTQWSLHGERPLIGDYWSRARSVSSSGSTSPLRCYAQHHSWSGSRPLSKHWRGPSLHERSDSKSSRSGSRRKP